MDTLNVTIRLNSNEDRGNEPCPHISGAIQERAIEMLEASLRAFFDDDIADGYELELDIRAFPNRSGWTEVVYDPSHGPEIAEDAELYIEQILIRDAFANASAEISALPCCKCLGGSSHASLKDGQTDARRLEALALSHFVNIETLASRGRDSLDFHEVSVWSISSAIEAAYNMGVADAVAKAKPTAKTRRSRAK